MRTLKTLLLAITFILFEANVFAGWVITTEKDEGLGSAETETTFVQDNMFKNSTDRETVIFNFPGNEISFINTENKSYWTGTLTDFKTTMVKEMKMKMESALQNVPEEHKEMMKNMYQEMIDKMESGENTTKDDLEIKKTNETLDILGHTAEKYQIFSDGTLREDIWISEDINIYNEMDPEQFKEFFKEFSNIASDRSVENSYEFIELLEKGYPLKTVEYHENFTITSTVVKIEDKEIPDSEFEIPAGYNKVALADLWGD